jgi:hypothetical protein
MALCVLSSTDGNGFVRDSVSTVAHDRVNFAQTVHRPSLNIHVYYCICHFPLVAVCYVMFCLNGPSARFGTDIPGQKIRGGNEINWHVQDATVLQHELF